MASSSTEIISAPAAEGVTTTSTTIKKTLVFTPDNIKKIGLDKIIKTPAPSEESVSSETVEEEVSEEMEVTEAVEENEVMEVNEADVVNEDEVVEGDEVVEEVIEEDTEADIEKDADEKEEEAKEDKIDDKPVSPRTSNMFCKNLKLKMQQVLQDKKISIVAKKKEQELVIIKSPDRPEIAAGRKIKVMQNQVIQIPKSAASSVNGNVRKVVVKVTNKPSAKKAPIVEDDEPTPVFKAMPMRTYKRKRSESDESPVKAIAVEEKKPAPILTPVKHVVKAIVKTVTKVPAKAPPVQIPKKRGRKSKAELAAIAAAQEKKAMYTDDEEDDEDKEESDAEEIIILQVPEKTDHDEDVEEIHFITDKESDAAETKPSKPKSLAEMVSAIKKKRGRRSKAELELLAKWDKETKPKKKQADKDFESDEDDEEEDEEQAEEEEDEEEVEQILMSPTRTGRVPKRNKMFDNYVTGARSGRKASTSDSDTPKPAKAPAQKKDDGENPTPRRRGRPPKNRNVETPKPAEKKVQEKDEDQEDKEVDNKSEAVHVTGDAEVIVIPKKRGRPAKKVEVKADEKSAAKSEADDGKEKEAEDDDATEKVVDKEKDSSKDDDDSGEQPEEVDDEEVNGADDKTDEAKDGDEGKKSEDEIAAPETKEAAEKEGKEAEVVAVRRRGRQPKKATPADDPKVKQTRGRKRKERPESPSTSADAADDVDEPSKRRKIETLNEPVADLGAPPIEEGATTKMYRLLVASLVLNVRERMAAAKDQPKGPGQTVTCAVCKANVKSSEWTHHRQRYHNNVTWKTTEEPLDLDNHYAVQAELNKLYPAKPFFCDFCNDSKKSALGFLTHKVTCNRTDEQINALKFPCNQCEKVLLPQQVVDHDKFHRKEKLKAELQAKLLENAAAGAQNTGTDKPLQKRKSAIRATEMIQQTTTELSKEPGYQFVPLKIMKKFYAKNNVQNASIQDSLKKSMESGEVQCIFGCELKFGVLQEIYDHFNCCERKPEVFFICKICLVVCKTILEFRTHVNTIHADEVDKLSGDIYDTLNDESVLEEDASLEDYEDEDEESVRDRKPIISPASLAHLNAFWKIGKFRNLSPINKAALCPTGANTYIYAKMLDFCAAYYAQELFDNYPFKKSACFPVNKNYIAHYLPRMKRSIPVAHKLLKTQNVFEFRRYKLFESTLSNATANIYCGGPITALAWAPTDYNQPECQQILAVAVKQDPDREYWYHKNDAHKNVIQLWNFGVLLNSTPMSSAPKLDLLIAHPHGGVCAMEWCPSGCYELDGTRLGLLAVCCTDGYVYCYSVGRSNLLQDKIVKPKPAFKLVLSKEFDCKLMGSDCFPTCMSWTKASGHQYIAVGYSNGIVGMFNIKAQHELLKDVDSNGVEVFYPYFTFKGGNCQIAALHLNYLEGGNRYIATSAGDRTFNFWDLRSPGLVPRQSGIRATSHQIFWPTNALTLFKCNDDASSVNHLVLQSTNVVDFDYVRPTSMLHNSNGARCISGSDWGGMIYQGNEAGDVSLCVYRDLHTFGLEVPCKKYQCSSTSVVVDEDVELTMEEKNKFKIVQKNHNILFHDYNLDIKKLVKTQERADNDVDASLFPIQAATATSTNPNRFSFLFNAVGYNIGFVRVFHSSFMNK